MQHYREPVSCFLFEMSYYELVTHENLLMVRRKRNYDIFIGIVTGKINANYHDSVAEMSTFLLSYLIRLGAHSYISFGRKVHNIS